MIGKIILALSALALVRAQIPSLGFCPDYVPMANFDLNRFLGIWYEAERYFQLTEVVSRCVMANYTKTAQGTYRVSNEVTNRFTGIKRVLEGEIKKSASKAEEGKLIVKYTIPLTPETKYSVLETDYDTYAVLWSCSGIGPFHTQNAWVMTRDRLAPGTVIQKAYGVLDKYKISKTFFVKTNQEDCALLEIRAKPAAAAAAAAAEPEKETAEVQENSENHVRTAAAPDAPEVIVEMQNAKDEEKKSSQSAKKKPINTVPERIMEIADAMKEEAPMNDAMIKEEKPIEAMKEKADIVKQKEKTVTEIFGTHPAVGLRVSKRKVQRTGSPVADEQRAVREASLSTPVPREICFTKSSRSNAYVREKMLRTCIILLIASAAMAQVPFLGSCPAMETMHDFDVQRYLGKWYEMEKYFAFFEFGGKCVTATYTSGNDSALNILNKQISSLTGVSSSIEGIGKPIVKSDDAKLIVTFPTLPLPMEAPYWVVDTDYTSYAVVWSCSNFGVISMRNVWILAREPKPPVAILEKAYQILDKNNISRAYFIRTDQKNCPADN
ncbi:uncharacterized protein LOC108628862 [Ceratina calcarata]|uniref:Apolipoprotein D n=1 Tax=Ceratina calcarata TaxID=156304 RepID=A0AAJ7S760_9HYME|nr:uncharacterized protein LOC108628862 [Ceratina calcarata]